MSDARDQAFRDEIRALRANHTAKNAQNFRRRPRSDSSPTRDDEDSNPDPPTPLQLSTSNIGVSRNVTSSVMTYAKKQKLRGDQLTQDTQTVRDAKLLIGLLGLHNDVQNLVAAKPPWTVSRELKVNIYAYATPVLLSPHLGSYKGDVPVQIVFAIVKKHRFDTPAGFEHNPAECDKLIAVIQEAFTQVRARLKKLLFASVKILRDKKALDLPPEKHQNLFGLAQAFVEGSKCRINGGLVGRIALMRKTFLKFPGTDFWDEVDHSLALMREDAEGDVDVITETFEALIDQDKELHGNVEIVYQGTDDIQEEVDASILAADGAAGNGEESGDTQ
ncbi:hypothetical protein B0H19DRAFT_1070948 [Mycena capillaripes]|nr:hypothetical protein B0H19DRAFT_1070948 [Mycena capillaripes]